MTRVFHFHPRAWLATELGTVPNSSRGLLWTHIKEGKRSLEALFSLAVFRHEKNIWAVRIFPSARAGVRGILFSAIFIAAGSLAAFGQNNAGELLITPKITAPQRLFGFNHSLVVQYYYKLEFYTLPGTIEIRETHKIRGQVRLTGTAHEPLYGSDYIVNESDAQNILGQFASP